MLIGSGQVRQEGSSPTLQRLCPDVSIRDRNPQAPDAEEFACTTSRSSPPSPPAFTAAWVLGLLTQRLRLSPIVGYLLAGVVIGPHTPGFVGDVDLAHQLAEVGVILLMFGVGLHFHLKDLLAVKAVAIPGAIGQSLVATLLGVAVFAAFGMAGRDRGPCSAWRWPSRARSC